MFGYHVISIFLFRFGIGTWHHCDCRGRFVGPLHFFDCLVCYSIDDQ